MNRSNVQTYMFEDDGKIPNNPQLPLLVYPGVLQESRELTSDCKALFQANHWHGVWINGVYNYHHYHSTAHEVLGIVSGTAQIQFGGSQGQVIQVQARDVVVIPAGVGHCNRGSSSDFRVIGAYPRGQIWDLCTGTPDERPQVIENIRRVPLPDTDPVFGADGPLLQTW